MCLTDDVEFSPAPVRTSSVVRTSTRTKLKPKHSPAVDGVFGVILHTALRGLKVYILVC